MCAQPHRILYNQLDKQDTCTSLEALMSLTDIYVTWFPFLPRLSACRVGLIDANVHLALLACYLNWHCLNVTF